MFIQCSFFAISCSLTPAALSALRELKESSKSAETEALNSLVRVSSEPVFSSFFKCSAVITFSLRRKKRSLFCYKSNCCIWPQTRLLNYITLINTKIPLQKVILYEMNQLMYTSEIKYFRLSSLRVKILLTLHIFFQSSSIFDTMQRIFSSMKQINEHQYAGHNVWQNGEKRSNNIWIRGGALFRINVFIMTPNQLNYDFFFFYNHLL